MKIVDSSEGFEECLHNVLDMLEGQGFKINLKREQKKAIRQLHEGKDLLSVFPTGYGKSLIFLVAISDDGEQKSIFVHSDSDSPSVLVVCHFLHNFQRQKSFLCSQIRSKQR